MVHPRIRVEIGRAPGLGLVTNTGRRSGKSYRTPVLVLRDGNRVVVPFPYGDTADWVRNVLAAGTAVTRYRGSTLLLSGPRVHEGTGYDGFGRDPVRGVCRHGIGRGRDGIGAMSWPGSR
jgi:deazaflavin-dependent oxidoreductase (nitroreductase family)